jgi:hypothetical protein
MFECFAILQFICLASADEISFDRSTIWSGARVRLARAELVITFRSDSPLALDPRSMDQACLGGRCVTYARRCETGPARVRCSYAIYGRDQVPTLELSAPDRTAFLAAEHAVRVAAGGGIWLHLAALDRVGQGEWPICQRAPRVPSCPEGADLPGGPGAPRR